MAGHAQLKLCHDGMLEDTNSLGAAHMISTEQSCINLMVSFTSKNVQNIIPEFPLVSEKSTVKAFFSCSTA